MANWRTHGCWLEATKRVIQLWHVSRVLRSLTVATIHSIVENTKGSERCGDVPTRVRPCYCGCWGGGVCWNESSSLCDCAALRCGRSIDDSGPTGTTSARSSLLGLLSVPGFRDFARFVPSRVPTDQKHRIQRRGHPWGVKGLERMIFKSMTSYGGDFSKCRVRTLLFRFSGARGCCCRIPIGYTPCLL